MIQDQSFKTSCTDGETPLHERRFWRTVSFCLDDRISPFFANVQLRLHQFGKESFTRNIFRICTSSWEKWCFGNSRSQSLQRRMWFSTPSSIPKLWYKMWLPNGFSRTRAKQKISGDGNESTKILRAVEKHKVINTHNSLKCGKTCEYLSWNHRTSTPHRSETNSIAARVVRRVKEGMRTMRIGFTKDWTVLLWDEREATSVTCESSLWALLRDSVTLADVLVLRTTGSKWYNSDYDDRSRSWEDSSPGDSTKDNQEATEVATVAEVEVDESRDMNIMDVPFRMMLWASRGHPRLVIRQRRLQRRRILYGRGWRNSVARWTTGKVASPRLFKESWSQ